MNARPLGTCAVLLSLALAPSALTGQSVTLTLEQAVALAQERSHAARSAAASRDAAMYRDQAFGSRLLPQLTVSGSVPSYNRSIIEVLQPDGSTLFRPQNLTSAGLTAMVTQPLPFTGGDLFVSSSLARLSVSGAQDDLSWQSTPVSVGIRQPLFRTNALAWDRREQDQQGEIARRRFLEAKEDIALQATTLFFAAYAAEATLANARSNAAVNDTLYRLNTGRYDIGNIGENDLLQSELALLRARTAVDAAQLDYDRAVAELELMLALPPATELRIAIPDDTPSIEADTARAVQEAMRNRSVVSQLELQDVQTERRLQEARRDQGFGATLQASYGFNATAPEMAGAYRDLLEARRMTVSVDIPLLQWGARKEGIHAAESERESVMSASEATREETALEARFAVLDLAQARRNLTLSATADTVAGKRFEIAYNRYVIGRISVDNLYIAQNEKDQARTGFAQALSRYWQAYYQLRRLTLYDFARDEPIR